ncbi:MAG: putative hydroxymethylpyrimidine transporter CytX [Firmicutes bacterium]|jgi:putative hydroxymethylpyrimidine transporter CytX|nr:putative hydroxymethylpyrimidine transporter CytX [Bacillota bacterium]
MKRKEVLNNSLLWFGAAVSVAEIFTGSLLAPLGFKKGLVAIFIGHIIGGILMYLAGMIGGKTKLESIKSSGISVGRVGSYGFSILNILQLIGWTAVMIIGGARALNGIFNSLWGFDNINVFSILICALIILWVIIGLENLGKINSVIISSLFILSLILAGIVFKDSAVVSSVDTNEISMGLGIELSVAMCLSWLPLIGDYTSQSKYPKAVTMASVLAYFFGGSLMYAIGLGSSIYANTSDISQILLAAGLGTVALLIVLLSTVTTTFLDVYSAGVSFENISQRFGRKKVMTIISIIGLLIAIYFNIEHYESFLLLIGSVFSPMISIMIADVFISKKMQVSKGIDITGIVLWLIGFILYRMSLSISTPLGNSVPVIFLTVLIATVVRKIESNNIKEGEYQYGKNN